MQIQHLVFNKIPTEFNSRRIIFLTNDMGTTDPKKKKKEEHQHEPHNLSIN